MKNPDFKRKHQLKQLLKTLELKQVSSLKMIETVGLMKRAVLTELRKYDF